MWAVCINTLLFYYVRNCYFSGVWSWWCHFPLVVNIHGSFQQLVSRSPRPSPRVTWEKSSRKHVVHVGKVHSNPKHLFLKRAKTFCGRNHMEMQTGDNESGSLNTSLSNRKWRLTASWWRQMFTTLPDIRRSLKRRAGTIACIESSASNDNIKIKVGQGSSAAVWLFSHKKKDAPTNTDDVTHRRLLLDALCCVYAQQWVWPTHRGRHNNDNHA